MRGLRNGAVIVTIPRGPQRTARRRPDRGPRRPTVAELERKRLRHVARARAVGTVLGAAAGGAALYLVAFAACLG